MTCVGRRSGGEAAGADVDDIVDPLHRSLDQEQRGRVDDAPEALEEIRRDDGVADPGLVLERQGAEALRTAGALANDDQPGDLHPAAVVGVPQFASRQHAGSGEVGAEEGHEMGAGGEAKGRVVGEGAVQRGHLGEWGDEGVGG